MCQGLHKDKIKEIVNEAYPGSVPCVLKIIDIVQTDNPKDINLKIYSTPDSYFPISVIPMGKWC